MLLRRVARPMLAAPFILAGIDALQAPQGHVEAARPVLDAVSPAVEKAVDIAPIHKRPDDELLIKIDAGVKITAGAMLAFGKFPRLAAAALAASTIPMTLAQHRFWEETDEQRKQEQQRNFLKNVGLLGGLLIAAADTGGKPSIGWRGRRAAEQAAAATAARAAALKGAASGEVGDRAHDGAQDIARRLSGAARDTSGTIAGLAAGLAGLAPAAGAAVSARTSGATAELASRASEVSADWSRRAEKAKKKAVKRGAKLQKAAEKRGAALQAEAARRSARVQQAASANLERGSDFLGRASHEAVALGHDVAARASAVSSEVAHQAEGAAKDARRRAHALTH